MKRTFLPIDKPHDLHPKERDVHFFIRLYNEENNNAQNELSKKRCQTAIEVLINDAINEPELFYTDQDDEAKKHINTLENSEGSVWLYVRATVSNHADDVEITLKDTCVIQKNIYLYNLLNTNQDKSKIRRLIRKKLEQDYFQAGNTDNAKFRLIQTIDLFKYHKDNILNFDENDFIGPEPYDKHPHRRYVTRLANLNPFIDPEIFVETQLKRLLRGITTLPLVGSFLNWLLVSQSKMKLPYFSEQEDKRPLGSIYVKEVQDSSFFVPETPFTLIHRGHATLGFVIGGKKIWTDPVIKGLAPLFYPSMTEGIANCDQLPDELPDVIMISHNHRDHVDEASLLELRERFEKEKHTLPTLLVPKGDISFFKGLGFTDVQEFTWHNETTIDDVTYVAVPADHRSGRKLIDSHSSLVIGWVVSNSTEREITYFAGDTAKLNDTRMLAVASNLYALYLEKKVPGEEGKKLPNIINIQPAGPNYTRKEMEPTHQSVIDSFISPFRLASKLALTSELKENPIKAKQWLEATVTVIMHSGKFELGPDRFNEARFLFIDFIKCLQMSKDEFEAYEKKQQKKNSNWSLFEHRKDFVCEGVKELRKLSEIILPNKTDKKRTKWLVKYLLRRTRFPLVNERFTSDILFNNQEDESVKRTQKWQRTFGDKLEAEYRDTAFLPAIPGDYFYAVLDDAIENINQPSLNQAQIDKAAKDILGRVKGMVEHNLCSVVCLPILTTPDRALQMLETHGKDRWETGITKEEDPIAARIEELLKNDETYIPLQTRVKFLPINRDEKRALGDLDRLEKFILDGYSVFNYLDINNVPEGIQLVFAAKMAKLKKEYLPHRKKNNNNSIFDEENEREFVTKSKSTNTNAIKLAYEYRNYLETYLKNHPENSYHQIKDQTIVSSQKYEVRRGYARNLLDQLSKPDLSFEAINSIFINDAKEARRALQGTNSELLTIINAMEYDLKYGMKKSVEPAFEHKKELMIQLQLWLQQTLKKLDNKHNLSAKRIMSIEAATLEDYLRILQVEYQCATDDRLRSVLGECLAYAEVNHAFPAIMSDLRKFAKNAANELLNYACKKRNVTDSVDPRSAAYRIKKAGELAHAMLRCQTQEKFDDLMVEARLLQAKLKVNGAKKSGLMSTLDKLQKEGLDFISDHFHIGHVRICEEDWKKGEPKWDDSGNARQYAYAVALRHSEDKTQAQRGEDLIEKITPREIERAREVNPVEYYSQFCITYLENVNLEAHRYKSDRDDFIERIRSKQSNNTFTLEELTRILQQERLSIKSRDKKGPDHKWYAKTSKYSDFLNKLLKFLNIVAVTNGERPKQKSVISEDNEYATYQQINEKGELSALSNCLPQTVATWHAFNQHFPNIFQLMLSFLEAYEEIDANIKNGQPAIRTYSPYLLAILKRLLEIIPQNIEGYDVRSKLMRVHLEANQLASKKELEDMGILCKKSLR